MEKQDELNPLTEQDLFILEGNRKRNPEFTFFYDALKENGYLSNWYVSYFIVDRTVYSSTELFMMNYKAILFKDYKSASKIMKTDDLMTIKNLGKRVKNYDDHIWGIGISLDDYARFDMTLWNGENRLGEALMNIRVELR